MTRTTSKKKTAVWCSVLLLVALVAAAAVTLRVGQHQQAQAERSTTSLNAARDAVLTAQQDNDDRLLTIPEVLSSYDLPQDVGFEAAPGDVPLSSLTAWTVTACDNGDCHTINQDGVIDPVNDESGQVNADDLPQPSAPETENTDVDHFQN
ncbi:hypothetical protein F8O06_05440 [Pseudoclavibacter sp. CFCC 14310]|uniref:hypothetical protein n=1 Tax=Pseudoclavibacter sp. CFCC 14310 TaxID=2615180 RepID=UPI001300DF0F|nr:hypothetical protein [Pseudoclavibacter sp. CFCC 14310]KAB1646208.1 hypothetical protein F8O06_05440 [Pseudoclavibacter sp. CFCC 14310]